MRASVLMSLALVVLVTSIAAAASQPVDVYLIGGQSNATGQGYLANLPKEVVPDTRVLLFHSAGHLHSGAEPNRWIPLRQASESPDRFGPEFGFGNRLQELFPLRKIAIIKHAYSGTNLHAQWSPGKDAADREHWGPQFQTFVATVEAGLKGLRGQGYEPTVCGMLWQQGESDANGQPAEDYGRNLTHFIARVREQFQSPEMLFVYGYVLPPPCSGKGRDLVRQAQRDLDQNSGSPLAVRGALVVPTDDLSHRATDANTKYPNDHVHFGTAGALELGRRMADRVYAVLATPQVPAKADQDGWITLTDDLSVWQAPTGLWFPAGGAQLRPGNDKRLDALPGRGVLVNGKEGITRDLVTRQSWGDVEIHLEFMIPRGSNSGIKLHRVYEVQICDSAKTAHPTGADCGGIYPRAELKPTYHHIDHGIAPRENAAGQPGQWQTLDIVFRAPRFDAAGRKVSNAQFEKIVLNGRSIHDHTDVPTPTGHIWRDKEHATGPILLQADHGPVAYRNVRLRPLAGGK